MIFYKRGTQILATQILEIQTLPMGINVDTDLCLNVGEWGDVVGEEAVCVLLKHKKRITCMKVNISNLYTHIQ